MPRYYFHFRENGDLTTDDEGCEMDSVDAALAEADRVARGALSERLGDGRLFEHEAVEVVDEGGRVVGTVVLSAAIHTMRAS